MSDRASSKNVFMVNCHASIKGLFAGMIVFSCTVISVILYAVFRNKIGDDLNHARLAAAAASLQAQTHGTISINVTQVLGLHQSILAVPAGPLPSGHGPFTSISDTPRRLVYSIAIVEIVNLCLLVTSLAATTWALVKIRKLQYRRITTRNPFGWLFTKIDRSNMLLGFDDVLIIVSLTGTYLYTIFSAFALLNNRHQSTWIAYLKIMIVILGKSPLNASFQRSSLDSRVRWEHHPCFLHLDRPTEAS